MTLHEVIYLLPRVSFTRNKTRLYILDSTAAPGQGSDVGYSNIVNMDADGLPVKRRSRHNRKKEHPIRAVELINSLLDETTAKDIDRMNSGYVKRRIVGGHEMNHSFVGSYLAGIIFLEFGTTGKRLCIDSEIEVVILLNGC